METKTMGEDDDSIQLYPAWRQAITVLKQEDRKEGEVLTYDWLYKNFSIEKPEPDKPLTRKQHEKIELEFLSQFSQFRDTLLEENQIALRNIPGRGYEIMPSSAQTKWAYEEGLIEVRRGIRKAISRLANVNLGKLTADERRENADALAKTHMLETMTRPRRIEREYRNKLIETGK